MREDNPYEILGINYDEDDNGIRKEYRKLALLYHPDKVPNKVGQGNGTKETQIKMAKINSAYAILGDQERKRQYDYIHKIASAPSGRSRMQSEKPFPSYFPSQSNTAKYFSPRHLRQHNQPLPPLYQSQTDKESNEPITIQKNRNRTTTIIKRTSRFVDGKKLTFREIATIYPDGRTQFKQERPNQKKTMGDNKSKKWASDVLFCVEGAFDTVQECITLRL